MLLLLKGPVVNYRALKKKPLVSSLAYTTGIEMGVPIQTFEVMKKTHNNPLWKDKATLLVMYLCCAMHPSQKKYHRISLCLFLE